MKILKMKYTILIAMIAMVGVTSCVKDLDVTPLDPNLLTPEAVYKDYAGYESVVAKLYAGFAITGQEGPAGNGDVGGVDEGFSGYVRMLWNLQELPTDEAICAWGDFGIPQLNMMTYSAQNPFVEGLYYRIYHQVAMSNEFLRQSTEDKLADRGQSDLKEEVEILRAEARFIRAFAYAHSLDLFGNVPFVLEDDDVGIELPKQIKRKDLFTWLETELKEIDPLMLSAGTSEYGRVDRGAAWMLLSRLYLNAEVYTGTANWADVITYTEKINNAYTFYADEFENMFLANNDQMDFIFTVPYDGTNMQNWGGTQFLIHSATGGDIDAVVIGIIGGWGGNRVLREAYAQFGSGDKRGLTGDKNNQVGMFFNSGTLDVSDPTQYVEGYGVMKFKNIDPDDTELRKDFVSTDYPMMRLAESYLMYAEAYVKGGNGDQAKALEYVNKIRERAYGDNSGEINTGGLTEDFILAERGRELFWECQRRTDLIRFNKYVTSDYLWQWKGGVENGSPVNAKYKLYPIPAKDIGANPGLKQNLGY